MGVRAKNSTRSFQFLKSKGQGFILSDWRMDQWKDKDYPNLYKTSIRNVKNTFHLKKSG
jgi:hypothetical protein